MVSDCGLFFILNLLVKRSDSMTNKDVAVEGANSPMAPVGMWSSMDWRRVVSYLTGLLAQNSIETVPHNFTPRYDFLMEDCFILVSLRVAMLT